MLESRIKVLRLLIWVILLISIPFWIYLSIQIWDGSDVSLIAKILISIVTGILTIGYLIVRYVAELNAAVGYLNALQNKQFTEALTLGRQYYGIRRHGLKGASGSNYVQDEQAITNDISAYSKT